MRSGIIGTRILSTSGVAIVVMLVGALLLSFLAAPRHWRIAASDPAAIAVLMNFLPPEQHHTTTFRWSTPSSRILLFGGGGRAIRLSLTLNGDVRAASDDHILMVGTPHIPFHAIPVSPGWRSYHLLLPPQPSNAHFAEVPITLGFSNYRLLADDARLLGIPLADVSVTLLPAPLTYESPALWQTLVLMWMLLLIGIIARWSIGDHWGAMLTIGSGLVLLLLVALAPDTFAQWITTLLPWPLESMLLLISLIMLLSWGAPLVIQTQMIRSLSYYLSDARGAPLPVVTVLLLVGYGVLFSGLPVSWRGSGALLILMLPGALLAHWLLVRGGVVHGWAGVMMWIAGGIAWFPLVLLGLQAIPGPVSGWLVLLICTGSSLALGIFFIWRPSSRISPQDTPRADMAWEMPRILIVILVVAGVLRMLSLGTSEFQGDEGRAILMAAGMMHGQDEILFLHRKGPMEILLPAGPMIASMHLNEWVARLPFALAGMGVVGGGAVLAWLFAHALSHSERVALIAMVVTATILALDGYLIAFSRMVQYQSIVSLLALAAMLCCWRFAEGATAWRALIGAAWFVAVGLLAHYDTIYVVPSLIWVVLIGGIRRRWYAWDWILHLGGAMLVGGAIVAAFYVPFVLHEQFERTMGYLIGRTGQGEQSRLFFNNLELFFLQGTFYSTTFQIIALVLILVSAIIWWLWSIPRQWFIGGALALLFLGGCIMQVVAPGMEIVALTCIGAFGALSAIPQTPTPLRAALLWFGVPFIALSFLINDPRTHVYTMIPPAALLAGIAVATLIEWLAKTHRQSLLMLATGIGITIVMLALPYLLIVFVRQSPEYYRTFPAERPTLYRAAYGDTLPTEEGYFGFPRRDGWKAVGILLAQGLLDGDYDCNQKERITGWYTRGTFRCGYAPDYFFVATHEPTTSRNRERMQSYAFIGSVLVNHRTAMEIYSRDPWPHPPMILDLEDYVSAFDELPVHQFPIQRSLSLIPGLPQHHLMLDWAGLILAGYDLDRTELVAPHHATLALHWLPRPSPLTPPPSLAGYELVVFVRASDGTRFTTATPHCGSIPPAEWHENYMWQTYFGTTAFRVVADENLPPGRYEFEVGLRHQTNGMWLPLDDGRETLIMGEIIIGEEENRSAPAAQTSALLQEKEDFSVRSVWCYSSMSTGKGE